MNDSYPSQTDTCVIIDCGSGFMKAGTQKDQFPWCIFPSLVGHFRSRYVPEDPDNNPAFVAEEAVAQRGKLSLRYPIDHGHIDDWLQFEELLNYLFYRGLNVDPTDNSVIITKPSLCSNRHEEKIAELMFELYQTQSLNIALQGLMALYSAGRTTGVACDIGEGVTQVVPVYDGYCDTTSLRRIDFGGQEITMYLQRLLADKGYVATTRDDLEHVRIIKEQLCYVAKDPAVENERLLEDIKETYILPDGLTLRDGTSRIELDKERFYAPEVLFDPKLIYRDVSPLHELVMDSIMSSPIGVRKNLMGSIFISGGTSLFNGLANRLEEELMFVCPSQAKSNVRVNAADDRLFAVWKGAQVFSALRDYQESLWISKSEYLEEGPNICIKKQPIFAMNQD
ncbi:actin family protein [Cryptosporidium andersoni]|uniref:Actin family protein n=1 Tax=Cryptosporidium andersoni TaxID=117008 RepID=A0A1J4MEJ3_9CRYT|nr:actin family protein [Cryptosporidium andersoni]